MRASPIRERVIPRPTLAPPDPISGNTRTPIGNPSAVIAARSPLGRVPTITPTTGCRAPARTMAVPHLHGSGRRTRLDGSRFRPLWGGVCRRRRRQNKQSCQRHSQNAHVSALCEQASSPGENGSAQTFYPVRQAFIAGRCATGATANAGCSLASSGVSPTCNPDRSIPSDAARTCPGQ